MKIIKNICKENLNVKIEISIQFVHNIEGAVKGNAEHNGF